MPRYELTGKVALVTGGARGIGLATALALLARGAAVAIIDLDAAAVKRVATELHASRALGLAADVTNRIAMQHAVATAVEHFGGLDVVVANAGVASRVATFRGTSSENFERVLDVNLMGIVRTVDAALPEIIRREGHIVLVSSIYAFMNGAGAAPYAMSKAAVEQLGRALRVELRQHGASASVAYFGFIGTAMVHQALDSDPLAHSMLKGLPKPLHKRLAPSIAGEAIVRGIERRQPRIIRAEDAAQCRHRRTAPCDLPGGAGQRGRRAPAGGCDDAGTQGGMLALLLPPPAPRGADGSRPHGSRRGLRGAMMRGGCR